MNQRIIMLVLGFGAFLGPPQGESLPKAETTITVLYDNTTSVEGTTADWGFSCLIRTPAETILFDSGTRGDILVHNAQQVGVSLDHIDLVVISHNHADHAGGLDAIVERNPGVRVFFPVSFPESFAQDIASKRGTPISVNAPREISDNVFLTGDMGDGIHEQSLILKTTDGLVIVTGCSHPGIVNILRQAKAMFDEEIYLVFGGFHLLRHSSDHVEEIIRDFESLAVRQCGATHCTGDEAVALFRKAYGDRFVPMGVGREIQVSH